MLLNIKFFVNSLNNFWLFLKLQTQIVLIVITLFIVLTISIIYGLVTVIQNLPNFYNNIFVNAINALFQNNLLFLVNEDRISEIITLCERLYENSKSVQYIMYIDPHGTVYGIPYSLDEMIFFSENTNFKNDLYHHLLAFINFHQINKIHLTCLLTKINDSYSVFLIGNSFNFSLFSNFFVTNKIVLLFTFVFVVVLILGTALTRIIIKHPLNEVSQGIVNITTGSFSSRVYLRASGELGELVGNFNELARRLQLYEEENIEQIYNEKIKLESLITTITEGILLLDTNLNIVLVNEQAIRLFNWKTKTKLIGSSIWDHLPIVLQKKFLLTLENILEGKQSVSFDGKIDSGLISFPKRLIRVTLKIVYNSYEINSIPIGIGLTIQDCTKEFELAKSQNRFISNISHELRTPLFNIKSFIETIQEYDYTLSNWQKRYFLDIVNKETNRLTRLVNDILFISKLDSRKEIAMTKIDFTDIIRQTIANYQIVARDKKLYLHSENSLERVYVYGNKDLLLQVLINLVGNALKFTYRGGEIVIRIYSLANKSARVEIFDTGIGVIDTYQNYIFQRFYRIENEVHTLKGTGLGLSIVNNILLEHKTSIKIISRYKVGSLFWFDLREV